MAPRRLRPREAAAWLAEHGCPGTASTLETWRCRGRGPAYYKVGRRIAYAHVLADAGCGCATACETRQERREHHGGRIARADGTVAFGPIWDWPTPHVWEYIAARPLPVNPAYAVLRAIGAPPAALRVSHLLDGHGIEHGRAVWLRRGWPGLFDELATLLPRLREFA